MEAKKDKPRFIEEVNETWLMLLRRFGWLALIFMGYIIYDNLQINYDFSLFNGILVLLAGIFTPLMDFDKKRIQKLEAQKDVVHLLEYVRGGLTPELWFQACDAVVRLGNSTVPLLLQSLEAATCPIKNPLGIKLASNSNLRAGAAYCLGKLKEQSAVIPLIFSALNDREDEVRGVACNALGEIGDKRALPDLQEIAQNDKNEDLKEIAKKVINIINEMS
jgi:HEAT repeat protein